MMLYDDTILWLRSVGGLGDILMHRMIFEDVKAAHPGYKLVFACPSQYHDAVADHPYLDGICESSTILTEQYAATYDSSTICGRYEWGSRNDFSVHRADLWAGQAGVHLEHYSMHLRGVGVGERAEAQRNGAGGAHGREIALAPCSSTASRNLTAAQLEGVILGLRRRGYKPYIVHSEPVPNATYVPTFSGASFIEWAALLERGCCVISVDTAAVHYAGGAGIPTVGVFGYVDGHVRARFYPSVRVVQRHLSDLRPCPECQALFMDAFNPELPNCLHQCVTADDILEAFDEVVAA